MEQTPMAKSEPIKEKSVKRCAVCKIDLRGRFVLVNDEAERMFGLSKDALFGRFLVDYLDEFDKQTLQQVLRQRNHYDSFFETTQVGLVTEQGKKIAAKIFISLCYIAGNPVNYQIIFHTEEDGLQRTEASEDPGQLLDSIVSLPKTNPWPELVGLVAKCTKARAVLVYRIDTKDDSIAGLLETCTQADDGNLDLSTTPLHVYLAASGQEYNWTNEDHVRLAIEKMGKAPDEFATTVRGKDEKVFVRVIFRSDGQSDAQSAVKRARFLLGTVDQQAAVADSPADLQLELIGQLQGITNAVQAATDKMNQLLAKSSGQQSS